MTGNTSKQLAEIFIGYRRALAKMLTKFVQPGDVEDIIQDTWVRLAQAELKDEIQHPKSFMYRTAKHLALDYLNRAEYRLSSHLDDQDADVLVDDSMDSTFLNVESSERFEYFCRALRILPHACRRAFILKKVYGFSQKEIAAYMSITESAVEKHVAKGLLRCTDNMRAKGILPESFARVKRPSAKKMINGVLDNE